MTDEVTVYGGGGFHVQYIHMYRVCCSVHVPASSMKSWPDLELSPMAARRKW